MEDVYGRSQLQELKTPITVTYRLFLGVSRHVDKRQFRARNHRAALILTKPAMLQ